MGPAVLLIGDEAELLASRLEVSGYLPLRASQRRLGGWAGMVAAAESPELLALQAVILSPGSDRQIAPLRERWGAIPLLLGIDQDTVDNRCRTLTSGADDFWLCSLAPSDLLTRLRLHLNLNLNLNRAGAGAGAGNALLQVGDLQLLPASRQVRRGLRALALTAREYELLLLLMRHRRQVVSREQIRGQIWDDQPSSASNVIEVYVRYLRQKLEEGGEGRLIHTVRGEGYCLGETRPLGQPR